jgi:hypothetical protein
MSITADLRRTIFAIIVGIVIAVAAVVTPAAAQRNAPSSLAPSVHLPPRIDVNPRHLLYRRCEDRYVLQHRPSGTVLFPERRCWWVRG